MELSIPVDTPGPGDCSYWRAVGQSANPSYRDEVEWLGGLGSTPYAPQLFPAVPPQCSPSLQFSCDGLIAWGCSVPTRNLPQYNSMCYTNGVMQQKLLGGISPEQYRWLKIRLGTSSDSEACRLTDVGVEKLRHWKKNPTFHTLLLACRTDHLQAFRYLSLTLSELALEALEFLLRSPKGSDKKAGLEAWRQIFRVGQPEQDDTQTSAQQIYNILNIRGDVPPAVLGMVNPLKQLPPAAKEVVEYDEGV